MATELRGTGDDSTRMMLGQVRKVFDPSWIQMFDSGRITIQFRDEPESREELLNFLEMYGFEYDGEEEIGWYRYYFR